MRDGFRHGLLGGVALAGLMALPGLAMATGFGRTVTLKPSLTGLISMGDDHCVAQAANTCQPDNSMSDAFNEPGMMQGYVINVTWAQLQPANAASFDPTPIDQAIATLEAYNAEHPATPMRALLRVAGGSVAPTWVKNLAGGPVTILLRANKTQVTVGRFWTGTYQSAWRTLQGMLASRYDGNPLIAEVSNTSCSHQAAEPYTNPLDSASIVNLFAAGYSNAAFQACLAGSAHDYDAWTTTPIDFDTVKFENLNETTKNGQLHGVYGPLSMPITQTIMQQFRAALGPRAILANHSLSDPIKPSDVPVFQAITQMGKPVEFQTASPGVTLSNGTNTGGLGNWGGAIALGIQTGGSAVEVWPSRLIHGGKPVQDGWNQMHCAANVPSSECAGQPTADLQSWSRDLIAAAP